MDKDTKSSYWDRPEIVSEYSSMTALFHGERLAFEQFYPNGLDGLRVLEIGCGGGRVTHFLQEMGAIVIAVDISEKMIDAARAQYPEIEYRVMNAESLDFEKESFDLVVFAFNGLDCLYPKDVRARALREIFRVLRPGGNFIFSAHNLNALMFGWYRCLLPRKLVNRASHVINGNFFRKGVYIEDMTGVYYYSRRRQVVDDLIPKGFSFTSVLPNTRSMGLIQKIFKTSKLTEWTDPWPYYVFNKPS